LDSSWAIKWYSGYSDVPMRLHYSLVMLWHWLRPGNTTQYLCRTNLAASCDCYITVSFNRTAPVESDRYRWVAYFFMPCRHCSTVVIIEPQLRMLRGLVLYPDYRVTTAPVAFVTKACCVVVALIAAHALTPDTLELVFTWIVVGCSRSWSHICATFVNKFVFTLYFVWLCCVASYIYIYRQVAITTILNLGN
jgi:hypothetical protein